MRTPKTIATIISSVLLLATFATPARSLDIVATTYPIHLFASMVTEGCEGVKLERLLPAELGCPHEYSLAPRDMRRLAGAEILIVNGMGMEEFLGAPLKNANPGITLIDTSKGAGEIPGGLAKNPHLFASPRRAANIVRYIGAELAKRDKTNAAAYLENARANAGELDRLADEMARKVAGFPNRRIIQPQDAFDYFALDLGLEIAGIIQTHDITPSAADLIRLSTLVKERDVGAVYWQPQYPANAARTLARETGIAAAALDPVASGPDKTHTGYYEEVMRANMLTLEKTLGALGK